MLFPRTWLAIALLCLAACNCGSELPDSHGLDAAAPVCPTPCDDGQTCDPASLVCVKALHEGEACGDAPDGGVFEGACLPGFSCGPVGGSARRCSKDCTAHTALEVCGSARKCFARPGSASSSGYCGTAASEGQPCDDSLLAKCSGNNLTCVSPAGKSAGLCFHYCDPGEADPNPECSANASCADPFPSDPAKGLCVVPPGGYPDKCDYDRMVFCGRHGICVRPTDEPWGYCHLRCEKSEDCAVAGQVCTFPSAGLGICVQAVARCVGSDPSACGTCEAEDDGYCGPDDFCVFVPARSSPVCKQDCSASRACSAGTCSRVEGTDRYVCLE
ncbi:MAG: hypothetical protein HY901_37480 [Deltaproteobacteria bacterium]|nr:hypothetical protein [Deltaproteobacteria bacterium]